MKRWFVLTLLLVAFVGYTQAGEQQVKKVMKYNRLTRSWLSVTPMSIHDMQYVTPESLAVADSLQDVVARYLCQASQHLGDTVVVTAVCVAPKGIIT